MNKKLISLFLAMVTGLSMLSGRSSTTSEEEVEAADTEESARVSMTLTLALPADNFTEESRQQVEDALNRLTTAKYDTAIELKLYPRDEYRDAYMAQLDAITTMIAEEEAAAEAKRQELKELKKQGITVEETEEETAETVSTEEETIINELGISIKQYPEVGEKQFDIFLVTNYEDYNYLIENELIQQLDGELSGTSKVLKTYIYPTYLQLANVNGTYAIPNNHPVGEYQFLLVNKELVDQYYYDESNLRTLLNCKDFIIDMGRQNIDGLTPLLGEVEAINMNYWGEDPSQWSVIASQVTNSMSKGTKRTPQSIFAITAYTNTVKMMKELNELGFVGDGKIDDGEKFAVGVISGDASVYETYGDEYYVNIYSKPQFTEDDVFGSMFAVSSYSKNLARSMEVLTYLNTSKDIRTVLQYGAEGIHWEYEDEDTQETIRILSNDYQMNINDTGNVYMTYPGEGISMEYWEHGKKQNSEAQVSPYFLYETTMAINDANAQQVKELTAISADIKARLDAVSVAEFDDLITTFKAELKENEVVSALLDSRDNENSLVNVFSAWFDEMNPQ